MQLVLLGFGDLDPGGLHQSLCAIMIIGEVIKYCC